MIKHRIIRVLFIMFLLLTKNIIILSVILSSSKIQSYLTQATINYFANRYDIELSIDNVYLKFPDKFVLENIYLEDQNGDTLLHASEFYINMSKIKILGKMLHIDKIYLVEPRINIAVDSTGNENFRFLLDKFAQERPPEKEEKPRSFDMDVFCNNFKLINAAFNYKNDQITPVDSDFDLSHIYIHDFNVVVNNFQYCTDTMFFSLNRFNLSEKSGMRIEEISSCVKIYDLGIELQNVELKANKSKLACSKIVFSGEDPNYLADPLNLLNLNLIIDTSYVNFNDLKFFFPDYRHIDDYITFSGQFDGSLSRLRLREFNLMFGSHTNLSANLSIDGLPNLNNTFIFGDINHLHSSGKDIERLLGVLTPTQKTKLPEFFDELGSISFTGNLVGLFNDLVAYGSFRTNLGEVRTDIAIITDLEDASFKYRGEVSAKDINLSKILNDPSWGLLSMSTQLQGNVDTTGVFNTYIKSNVSSFVYNNYEYKNLLIDGNLSNNFYEGSLSINDHAVGFFFEGIFDNRGEHPNILLYSDLWANLSTLNLMPDTVNSIVDVDFQVELTGELLSMPQGFIKFNSIYYSQYNDSLDINNVTISSFYDTLNVQHLTLRSDYIDMDFSGNYRFDELIYSLSTLVYNYLPSLSDDDDLDFDYGANIADFDIRLYDINEITNVFVPKLIIDEDFSITGNLNTRNNRINALVETQLIQYDSTFLHNNIVELRTFHDSIDLNVSVEKVNMSDMFFLENMNLGVSVFKDSIFYALLWDNFGDSLKNAGNLSFATKFVSREEHKFPILENTIFKSQMIIQNREWEIAETPIIIDTSNISINQFRLYHNNQRLNIHGDISQDPTKRLRYTISNVDVSNVNSYISGSGYSFSGILSSSGRIANIYETPSFRTSTSINDFTINGEDFGRFDVTGNYDGTTGAFVIDGSNRYMDIRGNYSPQTDTIDLALSLDNFSLEILEPYLNNFDISNLKGDVNVHLKVGGVYKDPQVEGYISFSQAEFVYDFLKLHAFTNDKVIITNNAIKFDNFTVYDEFQNQGTLNGGVYHENLKDVRFDFRGNVSNMKVLNTTAFDNSLYYGTAFASGNVRIHGTPFDYGIDVEAVTNPRTRFVLPMTSGYATRDTEFVTFVSRKEITDTIPQIQPVRSRAEYYFRMDLEITPEAEAQIVFDPQFGDLIRGHTRGNLNVEYTSDEEFYMYGELTIVEGDYLFSLQNVVNKRFNIRPGGTIKWDGDPNEATIDINAVYNLRAPMIDLMRAYADTSDVYRRPTNVECHMYMTGNLMKPDIRFNIKAPNADEKAQTQLASMSQDDINRQLLYLLILNRFYSPAEMRTDNTATTTDAFGVTSSELLSNQLSNWLSQISRDFDIGFNYRPGTEVSGQEVELALSTQLLDDRVLINGNVGYGEQMTSTANSLIGDVEIQVKMNPKGNFRVKGFTQINDELKADLGPYTSGIGIFYTQDFNSFRELGRQVIDAITFKKTRERRSE